tara:strand:+ start:225 stop:1124 length:900 start_codon:yes stop_codon:yes gene_type:complete
VGFFVCGMINFSHKKEISMKKLKLFMMPTMCFLILIGGCSTALDVPSNTSNVVNKYYDGYLANDSIMIASVLSTDYASIGYPTKEDKRNNVQEINFVKMLHNWHTDLTIEDKIITSYPSNNGYIVYAAGVENFKHNETGKLIDLRFLDIWSVNRSGKIQSRERFQDVMDYWSDIDYGISKKIEITFLVDMSNTKVAKGESDTPAVYFVSGGSTGPSGVKMVQGKNNIWSGKAMLTTGKQGYKFRNGFYTDWGIEGWEDGEIFKENKCGFNQWGDREIIVTLSDNQKVGPFCFNSCNKCD